MVTLIINLIAGVLIVLSILFPLWNLWLWFYKDKNTYDIEPDIKNVFNENVKPIEIKNNKDKAIIFIHGFPSSSASYKWVSSVAKQDYDVFAPILPGFATSLESFYNTYFTQWFNYICRYYEKIRKEYKQVYVVGMSMGGSITLKLNEKYDNTDLKPTSSCTIAAPIAMHDPVLNIYGSKGLYFLRFLSLFKKSFKARINQGYDKKNDGDETWNGYSGLFLTQGVSLLNALKDIKKDLPKITCPILLIHNKTDKTVDYNNMLYIDNNISSIDKKALAYNMPTTFNHNRHILLTYESTQNDVWNEIDKFFKENN